MAQSAVAASHDAQFWFERGWALHSEGDADAAVQCYRAVLEQDPDFTSARFNLAAILTGRGELDEASQHYLTVIRARPDHARAWCNLGVLLRRRDQLEPAEAAFVGAVQADSNYGIAHANLAAVYEALGRLDPADQHAVAALQLAREEDATPSNRSAVPLATLALARVRRRQRRLQEAAQLLSLEQLDSWPGHELRARGFLERGKVLDALGAPADAFRAWSFGQAATANTPAARQLDKGAWPRGLGRLHAWATEHVGRLPPAMPRDDGLPDPVLLVGFPRSGTTLAEQILAAHPRFVTSDESPVLEGLAPIVQTLTGQPYPEGLERLEADAIACLRATYWDRARTLCGAEPNAATRFVDKLPLNVVHLGLAERLFPTAQVVMMLRDPRDAVLSCFAQDFVLNEAMVHFCDLASTAALYERVMALWLDLRRVLRNPWAELPYEALVADLEGTSGALLDFLHEDWDDRVLDYHVPAAARAIRTPSRDQVSRPIYRTSVGKWRRYERELGAVLPQLQPFVQALGYDP